jgi:hypothetical protein
MTLRRALLLLAAGAFCGALALLGVAAVVAAATGVLSTPAGAWVVRLQPLPGLTLRFNVPALARLATTPAVQHLLDGGSLATRFGRVQFSRDGDALQLACAPCRVDDARLASAPVGASLRLTLARADAQILRGELAAGEVVFRYTAELARERIDIDWNLPPTDIAAAYRVLADAIPEVDRARIDGRIAARGSLRLPQWRAQISLDIDGFAVDGLGTERLAAGSVDFDCRDGHGLPKPRRIVLGEGRWVSPVGSGALLASAVLAAEDQRFHQHAGYDSAEIAQLLARIDEQGIGRGASTITQQLARLLFTGGERTAARKLRELLYAVEMERTLGKQSILALYLNSVDWGPGICGADEAARVYFGKRPGGLSPVEAAWLAGVLPNPKRAFDDEYLAGKAETDRAVRVLQQMRSLSRTERERWARQALVFAVPAAAPRRVPLAATRQALARE